MKQQTGKPREVAPTALRHGLGCLRLCTPEEQQEMERSLRRLGQLQAVLVYRDAGGWEVIDGFKRVRAACALEWAGIRVEELEVDAAGAKLRLWQSNAGRGMTELEEAWLIRSLHREEGWPQVEIARWFGRHKSWVNRRLLLAEGLADEVQADVRLGLLSVADARELCRLPRGNQAEVAAAVARHGLTSRQTARLVDEWLCTDDRTMQAAALADPARPGASCRRERNRRRPRVAGERILADADLLQRVCVRLQVQLRERSLASHGAEVAAHLRAVLADLRPVLAALEDTLERVTRTGEEHGYPSHDDRAPGGAARRAGNEPASHRALAEDRASARQPHPA